MAADMLRAYRVEEVAERLTISTRQVYRLMAGRQIRRTRVGGRTVVRADELERYLRRRTDRG
jgi:excisionase family DNA binding protein